MRMAAPLEQTSAVVGEKPMTGGSALTVTIKVATLAQPAEFVALRVYVVVADGVKVYPASGVPLTPVEGVHAYES